MHAKSTINILKKCAMLEPSPINNTYGMQTSKHKLIASGYNQVVELQCASQAGHDTNGRFHFTLIGQHYPDYLILEVSHLYRWQDLLPALRGSDQLVMRTISAQGEVIVGSVDLIHATQFPDKLLFVSYPKNSQTRALRKTPRMQIEVRGQLTLEGEKQPMTNGLLHDMAAHGFGFDCEGVLPCFEGQLLGKNAQLTIQLSDDEHETRAVRIKSVEEAGPKQWRIGLESVMNDDDRVDLMHRLLMNSIPVLQLKSSGRSEGSNSDKALQE